jgi:hypothetical protein
MIPLGMEMFDIFPQRAPQGALSESAHARSSGSETLLRSRSLADYTTDMHGREVFGSHNR